VNKEIEALLSAEEWRQNATIQMIASENFASEDVMALSGSVLTNKYAEGYPGKRYYNGCDVYDKLETKAIELACRLFGSNYANVQPHSGANANLAVMHALLQPGDTILSMDLKSGGHLSHGSPVNISGDLYNIVHYGVDESGWLNYEEIDMIAQDCKPRMIIAGGSAYPREIDWNMFAEIADRVCASNYYEDCFLLADMSHYAGLVAAGTFLNPVDWADVVTSTTHKTLRGPRGGMILWNDPDLAYVLNKAVFPGTQGGPMMNQIAAKAQCFDEALQPEFQKYAYAVKLNAWVMADYFKEYGYKMVSGGTHTHMIVLDLSDKPYTGREAANKLEENGIVVNKNSIPDDKRSPYETSGIRLGTAAETTRRGNDSVGWFVALAERISAILDDLEHEKGNMA